MTSATKTDEAARRARAKRAAIWLGLLAFTFYAGFIAMGVLKA